MIKDDDLLMAAAIKRGYLTLGCPAEEADHLVAEGYRIHYALDAARDEHLSGLDKNLLVLILQLELMLLNGVNDALSEGEKCVLVTVRGKHAVTLVEAVEIVEGSTATPEQEQEAWQWLHSTGYAYTLQGWYGRTAQRLLAEGKIS